MKIGQNVTNRLDGRYSDGVQGFVESKDQYLAIKEAKRRSKGIFFEIAKNINPEYAKLGLNFRATFSKAKIHRLVTGEHPAAAVCH